MKQIAGPLPLARPMSSLRQLLTAPDQRLRRNAVGLVVLLALMPSDGLGIDLCPFHLLTGITCPLCGLCRSISSLFHGDLFASVAYHPLGPVVAAVLTFLVVFNRQPFSADDSSALKSERTRVLAAGAVFLAVWAARLLLDSPSVS